MAKGFKCGGSGTSLNFTVKAYPSEVEMNTVSAAENTVGVVTTNPITGWYFDSEQPENMTEGEVWFCTGKISAVEFNALKKNGIQVYPIFAKQYISGVWVDVKAKTYQDGEWKVWSVYLFNYGKQDYKWQGRAWKSKNQSNLLTAAPSVKTNSDGSVTVTFKSSTSSQYTDGVYELVEDFDFTGFNTLTIDMEANSNVGYIIVNRNNPHYSTSPVLSGGATPGANTIDISAVNGKYDFAFHCSTNNTSGFSITLKTIMAQ